jgi:uncharacterized protein (DUF58 family)
VTAAESEAKDGPDLAGSGPVETVDGDDGTPASDAGDDTVSGDVRETPVRAAVERVTDRWTGVSALALVAGGAGIALDAPTLLVAAAVGVGYAAYARGSSAPETALAAERRFDVDRPVPGEEVGVTLSVRNVGGSIVPDLRLVDGVPGPLRVTDGSPRLATALRPGQVATVEYTVRAKRGDHAFDSVQAILRGYAGSVEREFELSTDERLVCTPSTTATREIPLRALTSRYTGRVETADGGEGVEFFATREYRPGDSLSRIDWNRHARTGNLATLEFRQERAATVVLVLDLRKGAYLRERGAGLHAADRGVDAASQVFTALLDTGDRVGVAAFSRGSVWLPPGTGNEHWARARELFGTHPDLSPTVPEKRVSVLLGVRRLRKRLPADAQVLLFSPLCDDEIVRGAKLLDAHGHLVTVLSPDPTATDTPGRRLARAERLARMTALRSTGIRVVDWPPDEELAAVVDSVTRRWST